MSCPGSRDTYVDYRIFFSRSFLSRAISVRRQTLVLGYQQEMSSFMHTNDINNATSPISHSSSVALQQREIIRIHELWQKAKSGKSLSIVNLIIGLFLQSKFTIHLSFFSNVLFLTVSNMPYYYLPNNQRSSQQNTRIN